MIRSISILFLLFVMGCDEETSTAINVVVINETSKETVPDVDVVYHKFSRLSPYDFNVEDIQLGKTNSSGEILISGLTEGDSVSFSKDGYLESTLFVKESSFGFFEPSNFDDGTIVTAKRVEKKAKEVKLFLHPQESLKVVP